jgi:hypothetical protein
MVTITGRNFGTVLNQVVLNVDVSNRVTSSVSNICGAVSQIDSVNFAAECPCPAGTGTNIEATVTIGGALSLAAPSMLNYAMPPIIDSVSSVTSDGGTVTVIGRNFGPNATESVRFSVINGQLTVTCKDPVTVANVNHMEVFVCTIPSSLSTQAVLYGLLDVVLSVNSLTIRVPALFSYVEIPVVTSISAGFQIDRSALTPTLTVTGTGFGNVANEIDLRLQVVSEMLSCLSVRFVRRALVSGDLTTIACTLPPFINITWMSYNVSISVRGLRVQSAGTASFVSPLTFPLQGGSQVIRGVKFGTANQQLAVTVSDSSSYSASMLQSMSSGDMQLIHSTMPESAAQTLNAGDVLLLVNTMSMDSIGSPSVVRFIHSKVTSTTFKLTVTAAPRSAELPPQLIFPLSTAAIPLPSSDLVYLVQRRSSADSVAVLTSNSPLSFDVGDPVVFMGEVFGFVSAETIYYIRTIIDRNSFSLSLTNGGDEILVPSDFPSALSGVMAIFSAYSTVITRSSGNTTIAASPSLIAVGDDVHVSGAGTISPGIYHVRSKPSSRSFMLTATNHTNDITPVLLTDFGAMIMSKFVERKCSSVAAGSNSQFECSGFPAFNDKSFAAIPGRFYRAIVSTSVATYATAVRWTS